MYVLVRQVGNRLGIVDTYDGVLEWLTFKEVNQILNRGIDIEGIVRGELRPRKCKIDYTKLNWSDGQNIFSCGHTFRMRQDNSFKFKAGKKEYKGHIGFDKANNEVLFIFSSNVYTIVPYDIFEALKNR